MNDIALLEHISLQLHTQIKKYSSSNTLLANICMRPTFNEPLERNQLLLNTILDKYAKHYPVIFSLNTDYYYSVVATKESKYLIGPVRLEIPIDTICKESYPLKDNGIDSVILIEDSTFFTYILLLENFCNSTSLTEENLLTKNINYKNFYKNVEKNLSQYLFQLQESETKHNSYGQELREQMSIEQGDITSLELAFKEDIVGEIGTLAKDKIRHAKNLAIVNITLASRSAIRGGLAPEDSYSMSDIYTQSVEEMSDVSELFHFMRDAEREYTRRVYEIRKQKKSTKLEDISYNKKIYQCKNYIFSHLHEQLTVQEIAKKLNLSTNYLSDLFKKHEGISISKYITQEKMSSAKNLLKYSNDSYIKIATHLGYCSQSHLGTQFKKYTGYTLKEYRNQFGKID